AGFDASGVAPGATIETEVLSTDAVGNAAPVASGAVSVVGDEADPALGPLEDTAVVESTVVPDDPPEDSTPVDAGTDAPTDGATSMAFAAAAAKPTCAGA